MLLAAGFGTRLKPLTNKRPKCLMPLRNATLAGFWLTRLGGFGAERVVVNTHHLAGAVRAFLAQPAQGWPPVTESHEPEILGTGGGLVAARHLLGEDPFLLVNGDVAASDDLTPLLRRLREERALAVLGVVDAPRFNSVAVANGDQVAGFQGDDGLPTNARMLTYSGLAAIHPQLLDYLPSQGFSSLVGAFRGALAAGRKITAHPLAGFWDDLGAPQRLLQLNLDLASGRREDLAAILPPGAVSIHPEARVSPLATLRGACVLGAGSRVEEGAMVKDSLLLPGAVVAAGARVSNAVLGDDFLARGVLDGGAHA